MKRCDLLVDLGRRRFLSGASVAAAGAAASAVLPTPEAKAAVPMARVTYPSSRLGNVQDLKINEPIPKWCRGKWQRTQSNSSPGVTT